MNIPLHYYSNIMYDNHHMLLVPQPDDSIMLFTKILYN